MIKDVVFTISFTICAISTAGLIAVIFFNWVKSGKFKTKVTIALAIICAISFGANVAVLVIDDNNLKKAVKETKTRETFLIENSVPLYLQEGIDTRYFYSHYEIEISEDGTYATLVPRNKPER